METLIEWTERGLVPDRLVRIAIRRLLRQRLQAIEYDDCEATVAREFAFARQMADAPIAESPELANAQHYELPTQFFQTVLGNHMKYSSCYWGDATSLDDAEKDALGITCDRAALEDGQRILELGCGWGSLSLWMAGHYPNARITAVSNSRVQRAHIEAEAAARGFDNLTVVTADVNEFQPAARFHRVVSVEMFEHMRNWPALYQRIAGWLEDDGRFFKHVFAHAGGPYWFEDEGPRNWMTRHFFGGGIMPSDNLPYRFTEHLTVERHWRWSGLHYSKTLEAWLARMDASIETAKRVIGETYGESECIRWTQRWRMFFIACSELFRFNRGQTWWVSHYRLRKSG